MATTALSRLESMSLSELKAIFFLISAIAELEGTQTTFDATNGLLATLERLIGLLPNRQDLFIVSNAVIARLVTTHSL